MDYLTCCLELGKHLARSLFLEPDHDGTLQLSWKSTAEIPCILTSQWPCSMLALYKNAYRGYKTSSVPAGISVEIIDSVIWTMNRFPTGISVCASLMSSRDLSKEFIPSDPSLDNELLFRRKCESLLREALTQPFDEHSATDRGWSIRHNKQGVRVFRQNLPDKELDKYVCVGVMNTSLPRLSYGLHADSSDDQRIASSILYEREFIDAQVLRVFETKDDDDSFKFSGIKYVKSQMPLQSSCATRDSLFYEYSGCRQLPNGGRYLFVVQDSVTSKLVPPYKNITREAITMVYLLHELSGGRVHFTVESYVSHNSEIPSWFPAYSYWQMLVRLSLLPETRWIVSEMKFLTQWVPDKDRKSCSVCSKKFNPLRSRHHCRACGDIMCSACSIRIAYTPLFLHSSPTKNAMLEHKVCEQCVRNAKNQLSMRPLNFPDKSRAFGDVVASTTFSNSGKEDGMSTATLVEEAKAILRGDIEHRKSRRTSSVESFGIRDLQPRESVVSSDASISISMTDNKATNTSSTGFLVCNFVGGELKSVHST
ncbi:hypothetical protein LEN26_017725 [Aphanomyces euteiches]|nr:hypothetical protein LEN26_017725 [Aphanomyces euteiches]KAH9104837.1 hypothetical protein AeMF1_019220 [Aphanomyces euteiches]KAH9193399.1 hypothetical protein AeNC1_004620 [Aphanomyces euteiches]